MNANTFIRTCKIEESNNLAADLNLNIQSVVHVIGRLLCCGHIHNHIELITFNCMLIDCLYSKARVKGSSSLTKFICPLLDS